MVTRTVPPGGSLGHGPRLRRLLLLSHRGEAGNYR